MHACAVAVASATDGYWIESMYGGAAADELVAAPPLLTSPVNLLYVYTTGTHACMRNQFIISLSRPAVVTK
jgi:hypothetical protein